MTLYLPGKSRCSICRDVVSADEIGFPAFLPKEHRLNPFSDGLFHRSCFENWNEKEEFLRLYRKFREVMASRPMNLKTRDEIEAWGKEAFNDLPGHDLK